MNELPTTTSDFIVLQERIEQNTKAIEFLRGRHAKEFAVFKKVQKEHDAEFGRIYLKLDHNEFWRKVTLGIACGAIIVSILTLILMVAL